MLAPVPRRDEHVTSPSHAGRPTGQSCESASAGCQPGDTRVRRRRPDRWPAATRLSGRGRPQPRTPGVGSGVRPEVERARSTPGTPTAGAGGQPPSGPDTHRRREPTATGPTRPCGPESARQPDHRHPVEVRQVDGRTRRVDPGRNATSSTSSRWETLSTAATCVWVTPGPWAGIARLEMPSGHRPQHRGRGGGAGGGLVAGLRPRLARGARGGARTQPRRTDGMIADCRPPAHRGRQRRRISGTRSRMTAAPPALAGGSSCGAALESAPGRAVAARRFPAARRLDLPPLDRARRRPRRRSSTTGRPTR